VTIGNRRSRLRAKPERLRLVADGPLARELLHGGDDLVGHARLAGIDDHDAIGADRYDDVAARTEDREEIAANRQRFHFAGRRRLNHRRARELRRLNGALLRVHRHCGHNTGHGNDDVRRGRL
jgi:hypothetical protein